MNELEKLPEAQAPLAVSPEIMSNILLKGDLKGLSQPQKIEYHDAMCKRSGLDPTSKPFDYIDMKGKLVLYANKSCCAQLRTIHAVSVISCETEIVNDIYVVKVTVQNAKGRTDCGIGGVSIVNLKGEALANAFMKAETKAKRRATLSICGLGMLDESEIDRERRPVGCTVSDTSPARMLLTSRQNEIESKTAFAEACYRAMRDTELIPATLGKIAEAVKTVTGFEDFHRMAKWLDDKGKISIDENDNYVAYEASHAREED